MGQACGCSDGPQKTDRMKELETLLAKEKDDLHALNEEYFKLHESTESLALEQKNSSSSSRRAAERIINEKKQIFKTMIKEKKKISQLEEEITDHKIKKNNMQKQIKEYECDIKEFQEREQSATSSEERSGHFGGAGIALYTPDDGGCDTPTPGPPSPGSSGSYNVNDDLNSIISWFGEKSGDKAKDRKNFNKKMVDLLTKKR
eukprot:223628_1